MAGAQQTLPSSRLLDQIRSLKFDHETIHHEFQTIRQTLESILLSVRKGKRGMCQAMLDNWKELHEHYINLLWKSKDVAGSARATTIDFIEIFVPTVLNNENVNADQRSQAMRSYIQNLEKSKEQSRATADGFKDLQLQVEQFCKEWINKIKGTGILRLAPQFKPFYERIAKLEDELRPLRLKLSALKITMGIIVRAQNLFSLVDGSTSKDNDGTALTRALARAEDEIKTIKRAIMHDKEVTDNSEAIIRDIAVKLGVVASIWAAIEADLIYVCELLEKANEQAHAVVLREFFNERILLISNHYKQLAEIFREFQVSMSGIPTANVAR